MGKRRRNLFVLLFVLGLIAVSALVIANKPTKLGLDLKGGVELVYQGTPTGQSKEVSGEDIDRSIEIIRERIDQLGVSEPEVSRLGTNEISVSLPDVTNAQRAIDQVGTTAQLYFYDWEPNLIGQREGDRRPPRQRTAESRDQKSERRMERSGAHDDQTLGPATALRRRLSRRPTTRSSSPPNRNRSPTARPARPPDRASTSSRKKNRTNCSPARSSAKKTSSSAPTGVERAHNGDRAQSPRRHRRRLRKAQRRQRAGARKRRTRLVRAARPAGALGHRHHQPQAGIRRIPGTERHLRIHRQRPRRPSRKSPGRSPSAAPPRRSARAARQTAEATSGHFAVVLDNEVKTRPIINYAQNPDGIDGRTGAQISGGFTSITDAQDLATILQIGALPINLKLISQTQVSATLGTQALHDGIKAGRDRPDPGRPLPAGLLPLPRPDRGAGPGRLRGDLLRPDQTDPDHPDAAGDRGPDADDRGRGRLQHRHLRANKGGGAGGTLDVERDRRRLPARNRDDHRRQRRHPAHRLHPLRAGHRGRQGLRLHPRRRHDRLPAHRGRLHPGAARLA